MDLVVLSGEAAACVAADLGTCVEPGPTLLVAVASGRGRVLGHVAARSGGGLQVLDVGTGDCAVAAKLLDALRPVARGGLIWARGALPVLERLGWVPVGAGDTAALVAPRG
jgi:aspartate aminotransferase-like enzyme